MREAQGILRDHGIDPFEGPENLTWAPNTKGQHTLENLQPLVEDLRELGASGEATRERVAEILSEHGQRAQNIGASER